MISALQLYSRYGAPENESNMMILVVPVALGLAHVPRKIYCNKAIGKPLLQAFTNVAMAGLQDKIRTWDGCFNIRKKRGAVSQSLHSWGYAVDINAAWNAFGKTPTMDPRIVQCFKEAGFDWGGIWRKPDGMHFQYSV